MALRWEESSLPLDGSCQHLSEISPVNDDILCESATRPFQSWLPVPSIGKTFRTAVGCERNEGVVSLRTHPVRPPRMEGSARSVPQPYSHYIGISL